MEKYISLVNKDTKKYAFIDETGNCDLDVDKDGVSSHFIITAIIVEHLELDSVTLKVDEIRRKYFGQGEIKSSKIGKNHDKRIKILTELKDLNFFHYSVIVDKRKIDSTSPLQFKKTFLKFLNSKLHDELKMCFSKLELVSDQHGTKEFMSGFVKYVNERNIPNLFDEYEFGFNNSKENVLIQVADLYAGTLSYKYDESKDNDIYNSFQSLVDSKCLYYVEWPFGYEKYLYEYEKHNGDGYDSIIYKNSIRLATTYINQNEKVEDFEIKERVIVVKYLLTMLLIKKNSKYVSSKELVHNLKFFTKKEYTSHYFKTRIIAKLRDAGVLISSSSKGYKIPESKNDIYDFVNQTNQMITPMIHRLNKARTRIMIATNNELDILDKKEYRILRELVKDN